MKTNVNRSEKITLGYYCFLLDAFSRFTNEAKIISPNLLSVSDHSIKPSEKLLKHFACCMKNQSSLNLEFGVWKGRSIKLLANALDPKIIYGFDSFSSFPEDGRIDIWDHDFSIDSLPEVPLNVQLIEGFYEDTLPKFLNTVPLQKSIVFAHIDCDIYSSTSYVLKELAPLIGSGSILIFDELLNHDRMLENELLALFEFLEFYGLDFEWAGALGDNFPLKDFCEKKSKEGLPVTMSGFRKKNFWQTAAIKIIDRPGSYTERTKKFEDEARELRELYRINQPLMLDW